jgi:hypothetical protein
MAGRPIRSLDSPVVTAHLDPDIARRTRSRAKETGHSLSSIVNDALKLYFARRDLIEAIDHDALLQRLAAVAAEQIAAERGEI